MKDFRAISNHNRPIGISGMMRVRNDAEFIEESVKSCIDALDELIIVYNDCTDNSPEIINELQRRYLNKIKAYEYSYKIIAWNLDEDTKEKIIHGDIDIKHTLAGYYNFALHKTNYKYVLKIDADQIYYTPALIDLCNCYRCSYTLSKYSIKQALGLYLGRGLISLSVRFNLNISLIMNRKMLSIYQESLMEYIKKYKNSISLSGVNITLIENKILVSLGKITKNGCNIMGPFNGEGDHLIFKVSDKTYFEPCYNLTYNNLNGGNINVIEQFRTNEYSWPFFMPLWIHLNANRLSNLYKTRENYLHNPEKYIELCKLIKKKYSKLIDKTEAEIIPPKRKIYFSYVFKSITDDFIRFFSSSNMSIKSIINNIKK